MFLNITPLCHKTTTLLKYLTINIMTFLLKYSNIILKSPFPPLTVALMLGCICVAVVLEHVNSGICFNQKVSRSHGVPLVAHSDLLLG